MKSSNPILSRSDAFDGKGGYATFNTPPMSPDALEHMYEMPSATSVDTNRMTLDDVIMRTATLFGLLLVTAAVGYFMLPPSGLLMFGSMIAGLVLALVVSFSKSIKPGLMLAYAAVEGIFVGQVSQVYAGAFSPGVVPQAILGTLAAFGAMLMAYKMGWIKNSPKFTKTLLIAGIGYFLFAMVNLLLSMFTSWTSVYAPGPDGDFSLLAIGLSAFGVVLASLFLVLDFDFIETALREGAPSQVAWVAAFGLVVTLVWLYLEMLRLVAMLTSND